MAKVKVHHMPGQRFGRSGEQEADWVAPGAYQYAAGQSLSAPLPGGIPIQTPSDYNVPSVQTSADMSAASDPTKVPYAMGMDKDTYQRVVLMPATYMGLVFTLLLCSMYTRFKRGKPVSPWSCCPYSAVGGSTGQLTGSGAAGTIGPDGTVIGSGGAQGSEYASVRDGGTVVGTTGGPAGSGMVGAGAPGGSAGPGGSYGGGGGSMAGGPASGPGSMAGGPGGSVAGAGPGGSTAAAPAKDKAPLPYERIPTPGVSPYLWSPPATIFQPSPTPPGTPFAGASPTGGVDADADDSEGAAAEDGFIKGKRH